MGADSVASPPSPALFFDTVNAYQRSAAIKAAVELGVFTAVGEGDGTAADVARRCGAAERGVRILCDYLTVLGFLTKSGEGYAATADTAMFLDRRSPAYAGGATEFLLSEHTVKGFDLLTEAVRRGGTAVEKEGTIAPEHPVWVQFARGMTALVTPTAEGVAEAMNGESKESIRVLDIAAGHGMYGLAFARRNPNARVTGQDWPNVLEVAKENARRLGVADRYETIGGSAFDVDLGGGRGTKYDVVLVPNFLHHFDAAACERLLKRVRGVLTPTGRVGTVEFIPNEDRVSPPTAAGFAIVMLAHTPGGDAYTFKELEGMFRRAGFSRNEVRDLGASPSRLVVSRI